MLKGTLRVAGERALEHDRRTRAGSGARLSMIGAPAKVGAPGVGVAGGECIASPLELLPSPIMRERALRVGWERAL